MKRRFRLFRRSNGGRFYLHDDQTGKQKSLGTADRIEAERLCHARNEAERPAALNIQIGHAYLAATDPEMATRTWQTLLDESVKSKTGSSRERYERAARDHAYDSLRQLPILQTRPGHFLKVLEVGSVSTNAYLRRWHNFALAIGWLPTPVLRKHLWPGLHYREKRGITAEEHLLIVARETNAEWQAFYELAWQTGAAQGDLALLRAEDIDWEHRILAFSRKKTGSLCVQKFGEEAAAVLKALPISGLLFPELARLNSSARAARFAKHYQAAGMNGISLHSYRYAWAERAKTVGYPERFAQEALGHRSKAVHRAYARKARVELPALEDFEKKNFLNSTPGLLSQAESTSQ